MKKNALLFLIPLVVALCQCHITLAQDGKSFFGLSSSTENGSPKKFRGGLYFGAVTSQMSGDGLGGWNKLGLNAGAFVVMPFRDKIAFNLALGFINKGSKKPADPNNGDNLVFIYRLNYIEVPALLEFSPGEILRIKAGPAVGILVKQKTWSNATSSELDITPTFKPIDLSGVLGIEAKVSEKLSAEIRTTTSIVPARNAPSVVNKTSYYEQGNYNQTLQLLLYLRF